MLFHSRDGTIVLLIQDALDVPDYTSLRELLDSLEYLGKDCYKNIHLDRQQLWFHKEMKPFCTKWKKIHPRWQSNQYTDVLADSQAKILERVQQFSDEHQLDWDLSNHNSCLVNKYQNGNDHIPPHSDSKLSFGEEPIIIGYSMGEQRKLILDGSKGKIELELEDNSIFVMAGRSQLDYKHSIPVEEDKKGKRYSMTIRHHLE